MNLNKLQQKAFDLVVVDKEPVVVLTGSGGTGKSTTTAEIIRAYKGEIAVTATTNKAKDVLAQASSHHASTIQSRMGFVIVQKGFTQDLQQMNDPKYARLIVVDEISMLPYNVYAEIMRALDEKLIQQVLFLGDPIQLKAIGKSIHPDEIPGVHLELMEQMRQTGDDPSRTAYLQALRTAIEEGHDAPPPFPEDSPSLTLTQDHKEFADAYNAQTGIKKIIAYRNRVVDKYNTTIHEGDEAFLPGDSVIIDQPLGKARNGDLVNIISVDLEDKLDRYRLRVVTTIGERYTIYHWNNTTAYNNYLETFVDVGDEIGYWKVRNESFGLKHQYACTVFKAQGSSYDAVFLDGTDLWNAHATPKNEWNHPISMDDFLRMLYVSVSRMREHCYVFVGDLRRYEKFSV